MEGGTRIDLRLWWSKGLLIGIERFERAGEEAPRMVEAWWDAGYVNADLPARPLYPANPHYTGKWVKVPVTP